MVQLCPGSWECHGEGGTWWHSVALEPPVLPQDTPTVTLEHGQLKAAFLETSSDGLCVWGGCDDSF